MERLSQLPVQPEDVPFPTETWPRGIKGQSPSHDEIAALADVAFADADGHGETLALLAVHRGRLVFERYGEGHGPNETYRSWSMAKSVLHALVGLLIRDEKLSLDGPAPVPSWKPGDPRHEISLDDLLRMQDGLDFIEEYVAGVGSHVISMLFQEGQEDVAAFAEGRPPAHPPGTHWNYSSGTSNIVAAAAGRAIGDGPDQTHAYLKRELLQKIGMMTSVPKFDAAGTFIASSFLFSSAQDFARFGLFYMRDGVWDGERILPEGWVDHARTTTPSSDGEYGAHWWLRLAGEDSFHCRGFQGQYILCVPSRDLVVVRLGVSQVEQRDTVRDWFQDFVALFD